MFSHKKAFFTAKAKIQGHRTAQTAYCALVAGVVAKKICIRGFWTILQKEKRRSGKAKKEKHNLSNQRPMLLNKEVTSKTKIE